MPPYILFLLLTPALLVPDLSFGQGKKDPAIKAWADSLKGQEKWLKVDVLRIDDIHSSKDVTNIGPDGELYYRARIAGQSPAIQTETADDFEEVAESILRMRLFADIWRYDWGTIVRIHKIKPGVEDLKIEIKQGAKGKKTALRLKFEKNDYSIDEVKHLFAQAFADTEGELIEWPLEVVQNVEDEEAATWDEIDRLLAKRDRMLEGGFGPGEEDASTTSGRGKNDPAMRAWADSLVGGEKWLRVDVLRVTPGSKTDTRDPTNVGPDGRLYYKGIINGSHPRVTTETADQYENLGGVGWRFDFGTKVRIDKIKLGGKDIKFELKEGLEGAKAALRLKFEKDDYSIRHVKQLFAQAFTESLAGLGVATERDIALVGENVDRAIARRAEFLRNNPGLGQDALVYELVQTGPYVSFVEVTTNQLLDWSWSVQPSSVGQDSIDERAKHVRGLRASELGTKLVIENADLGVFWEIWGGETEVPGELSFESGGWGYWIFDRSKEVGRLRVEKKSCFRANVGIDAEVHDRALEVRYDHNMLWANTWRHWSYSVHYDGGQIAVLEHDSDGREMIALNAETPAEVKIDVLGLLILADFPMAERLNTCLYHY